MFRNPLIDVIVVLVVVLVIFGPKRLPSLGRGLGQGMKEFKDGITGKSSGGEGEERAVLSAGNAPEAAAAPETAAKPETTAAAPERTAAAPDTTAATPETTPAAPPPPESAEVGSAERRS